MIHVFAALLLCILLCAAAAAESFVYGQSEQGRDLVCLRVGESDAANRVLLVFGIHGFEDHHDRDGQILYDTALRLEELLRESPLGADWAVWLVPTANPDGLYAGDGNQGFGRCNASVIDINRDFPCGWKRADDRSVPRRSRTGKEPFATAEARGLRDLAAQIRPTASADVHGWLGGVNGTGSFALCLAQAMKVTATSTLGNGMLSRYLDETYGNAALLELPKSTVWEGGTEAAALMLDTALRLYAGTAVGRP